MTGLWTESDMMPEEHCKEVIMDEVQAVYTLTGAADWPMLATVGGLSLVILQAIVLILIGVVYRSLPKHQDLRNMYISIGLDIEKLALRFEHALEKHADRDVEARIRKDDDILSACEKHRIACQAR
jgi:hypothetical protein